MHFHIHGNRTLAIVILYIFTIILLTVGILFLTNLNKNKRYYRETTAEIVDIVEHIYEDYVYDDYYDEYVYEERIEYQVYIDYEVDGEYYRDVEHCEYNSGMRIGDKIIVTYDYRDPSTTVVSPKSTKITSYIMFGVGALCGTIATALLVSDIKHRNYNNSNI